MKRSLVFAIILGALALILIGDLIFHLIYFNNFHKNIRPVTESEKQRAIEIINKTINVDNYQLTFRNVFTPKKAEVVQVELKNNSSRLDYFVDLTNGKVWKR
jgi:hypothetical protein